MFIPEAMDQARRLNCVVRRPEEQAEHQYVPGVAGEILSDFSEENSRKSEKGNDLKKP